MGEQKQNMLGFGNHGYNSKKHDLLEKPTVRQQV
jgi:hypothetical protein